MLTLGYGWCRDCMKWLKEELLVASGRCQPHANADCNRRYASDPVFRCRRRNRTAMRKRGVEAVPPEGYEALLDKYGGLCVYCTKPADSVDHMHPVSRGGRTTPGNIVPACRSCNSKKKDMPLDDWLDRLQAKGDLTPALENALCFMECSFYG